MRDRLRPCEPRRPPSSPPILYRVLDASRIGEDAWHEVEIEQLLVDLAGREKALLVPDGDVVVVAVLGRHDVRRRKTAPTPGQGRPREDWVAPLELAWPFLTVRMTIGGEQVRLLVDTGSTDLVLFKSRLPAALSGPRWRGDKTVQYASGTARLQRLDLRQVGLGEHVWDKLEGWTLDRVPREYPTSIDGVLGVMSLGCTRVRFDFERSEFGCSR